MKTPAELDTLKAQWAADPCWDLEFTEGFEAHYDELLAHRLDTEAKWRVGRQQRLAQRAHQFACSVPLILYLESLEDRIHRLNKRIEQLEATE